MFKLGFIGVGIMAGAILDRILDNLEALEVSPEEIVIYDINHDRIDYYKKKGLNIADNTNDIFANSDVVFLGVKPQHLENIFAESELDIRCNTVVSMLAGTTIKKISSYVGDNVEVIRIMPNLPVLIGKGYIAYCHNKKLRNIEVVLLYLKTCGTVKNFDEKQFSAVTSISGSGPAYVAFFLKSFSQAAIKHGFNHSDAKSIVFETVLGTVEYLEKLNIDFELFISNVCSKGGTTIEAIDYLHQNLFDEILVEAITKCKNKADLLDGENNEQ